jgi:diguanylate cyclase
MHGLAPVPSHFAVAYSHLSGQHPNVTSDVTALTREGGKVSPEQFSTVYEKYFGLGADTEKLSQASARIEAAVGNLVKELTSAGENTRSYGATLDSFSGTLTEAVSIDTLKETLTQVLKETRRIEKAHRAIEERVKDTADEMIELKESLAAMRIEATTDPLTCIGNRKLFERKLVEFVEMAHADNKPLSIIFADIDLFKSVNDSFGHQVGDMVLKRVGETLVECVKGRDLSARYGGEEFVVLLPDTASKGAYVVAEEIRQSMANKKLTRKSTGEVLRQITLSLGIAELRPGESADEMLARADAALYAAKRSGRNRTMSGELLDIKAGAA